METSTLHWGWTWDSGEYWGLPECRLRPCKPTDGLRRLSHDFAGGEHMTKTASHSSTAMADRYLALLRKCLTRDFPEASYGEIPPNCRTVAKRIRYAGYQAANRLLRPLKLLLVQKSRPCGETMMGMGALNNLHACMDTVTREGVSGDFVETGVWRGGGTMYMRAFLDAHDILERCVWVCGAASWAFPHPRPNMRRTGTTSYGSPNIWPSASNR